MKQFATLYTKDKKIVTINYDHVVKFYEVGNGEGDFFYQLFFERAHEDDARLDEIKDSLDGIKSALIDTANTLDAMYLNGIG